MVINEDTTPTAGLWATARTKASITYLSPEMVLLDSFAKLWKDSTYRRRLSAVIIDEAHCIEEWGIVILSRRAGATASASHK